MSAGDSAEKVSSGGEHPALQMARAATGRVWTEEFFRRVVCSMDEGVLIVDPEENILFANPATARIVGYPQERLLGMNLAEFLLPEELPHIHAETARRSSGKTSRYRTRIRRSDGDVRVINVTSSPLRGADGEVIAAAGVFMDVTEHRRNEEALRRAEQDKAVILSSVSELVNYQDADLRVRWANRAAGESVGQDPEELVGRHCYEIWHGREKPCDGCPVLEAMQTGRPHEGGVTTPDGRIWSIRAYPVRGESGAVVGSVEVALEVTEQVRATEALQRHADRLEALRGLDKAVLGAGALPEVCRAAIDCIRRLIDCSYAGVAEFDLERGRAGILATNVDDIPHCGLLAGGCAFDLGSVKNLRRYTKSEVCAVNDLLSTSEHSPIERNFVENGLRSYFTVPLVSEGRLIGVLCVGSEAVGAFDDEDIDVASEVANPVAIAIDRERREREKARLVAAVHETGEGVAILSPSGETEYVNPAAESIVGCSAEEVRRRGHESFLADDTGRLLYAEMWREVSQGRVWSGRANLRRADGTVFPAEVSCSPLRDVRGEITSYIIVGHDATEKAALEAQLRHSQKMEAIGRLAGGVAHDFNNILTVILGNAELLEQSHGSDPRIGPALSEISRAGRQAADLTQQLLAFARKGKFSVSTVDLHETITEVTSMLKPETGRKVEVVTDLSADSPNTVGDPTQLKMALLNLGINACDAMESGGTLTFATKNVTLQDDGSPAPGDYVEISVSDTGCGMDEATRARIFEPFFTTKELGRGTGLGLASVYGCVEYHGGSVSVETAPREGTTFRLLLPAGALDDAKADETAGSDGPERGRILLVDDEDDLRGYATRALTRAGFEVTDCGEPGEALEIYRQEPMAFALVIVDLIMPDMSGRELFGRIKHLNPNAKVAVTTGAERDHMTQGLLAAGAVGFIPKPFDVEELIAAVKRFLSVPLIGKIA